MLSFHYIIKFLRNQFSNEKKHLKIDAITIAIGLLTLFSVCISLLLHILIRKRNFHTMLSIQINYEME